MTLLSRSHKDRTLRHYLFNSDRVTHACPFFKLLHQNLVPVCHLWDSFFEQNLHDDLEKQEGDLQKFGSLTNHLLKECHPPVAEALSSTLQEVNMRYRAS